MVGFPRESRISRAWIRVISNMSVLYGSWEGSSLEAAANALVSYGPDRPVKTTAKFFYNRNSALPKKWVAHDYKGWRRRTMFGPNLRAGDKRRTEVLPKQQKAQPRLRHFLRKIRTTAVSKLRRSCCRSLLPCSAHPAPASSGPGASEVFAKRSS